MKTLVIGSALAIGLAGASPASAASAPYQAQVLIGQFTCQSGWCTAPFPAVPAGKTLTITNTSCVFTINGSFIDAQLQWNVSSKPYYLGLASEWQRANGANLNATFGKDSLHVTVAAGKKVSAVIQITGSLLGAHCEIFGTLD